VEFLNYKQTRVWRSYLGKVGSG